jgi:hypothetical protein
MKVIARLSAVRNRWLEGLHFGQWETGSPAGPLSCSWPSTGGREPELL